MRPGRWRERCSQRQVVSIAHAASVEGLVSGAARARHISDDTAGMLGDSCALTAKMMRSGFCMVIMQGQGQPCVGRSRRRILGKSGLEVRPIPDVFDKNTKKHGSA